MDFRGGNGFREGKLRVFDHYTAEQGDEENAEGSADHHESDALPVVVGAESGPHSADDEGRDGESGTGGDGFSDGTDGSRHVFFQQAAFDEFEQRHADYGS